MYAPRARFERVFIVSPIKVAIIFLTGLHCLFLFIAFLSSFWIELPAHGRYGPLFSCIKHIHRSNNIITSVTYDCQRRGFAYDIPILTIPLAAILLVAAFALGVLAIVTAKLSLNRNSFGKRQRYWLSTILLLLFGSLADCFVLASIPLSHREHVYQLHWAYGVQCGATLFISVSLIVAILSSHIDDVHYVEGVDDSAVAPCSFAK